MQKVFRQWTDDNGQLHGEWCYPAEEVDAYRQAVKALVEAVTLDMAMSQRCKAKECDCTQHKVIKAIAAVERLEVE